jgi:mono/diheme cytochrome c family protein
MNKKSVLITMTLAAAGTVTLLTADTTEPAAKTESVAQAQIERGKYLVRFGDCATCHTPMKMGPNGPEPDLARFLSGHPAEMKLLPPDLKPGPWFAATAGMTAWAGPWGISYAANLTPDKGTGLGIWTEDMFLQAMRSGKHMGAARPILPPMPWQAISTLSDEDLKAIFVYLRSLPAISNRVPDPVGPDGKAVNLE